VNTLITLGALAETLIPADDTPGADPAWAQAFVARQAPDVRVVFDALATYLETLARSECGSAFAALSIEAREALLYSHHPTLLGGDGDDLAHRRAMRDLIAGFLSADGLDVRADPYRLDHHAPRRDREQPSTPEYSTADFVPDAVVDRHMATWVGTGTYARVWKAGGYAAPPGVVPHHIEDVTLPPELLALKRSK
jgi:hypothetical protein